MKDLAITASDKIYEQDDLGPVQSIKNSFTFVTTQITQIAQFLQDNEYEITTANKTEEKVSLFYLVNNPFLLQQIIVESVNFCYFGLFY